MQPARVSSESSFAFMRERRSELSTDDGSMKRKAVQWEGRKDVEKLGFGKVRQENGSFGVMFSV